MINTLGSDILETPPSFRISAGTRSRAITAHALKNIFIIRYNDKIGIFFIAFAIMYINMFTPASSAILACSTFTTSIISPPLHICAKPDLTTNVPSV